MMNEDKRRLEGVLLLGAVGDALGAPVEFQNADGIEALYGLEPPEDLAFTGAPPAKFTDDTQMTLFMAEGLHRAIEQGVARDRDGFRHFMARSLVHWLATQDPTVMAEIEDVDDSELLDIGELHVRRAPGNTCLSGFHHIHRGGSLPDMDNRINDSKGCGAIMRAAPFGLRAESADQAFRWARDAGVLTHCHPSGYLSAGYFAATIYGLLNDQSFNEAMEVADELLAREDDAEETIDAVAGARRVTSDGDLAFEDMIRLGEGWVGEEALAIALAVAMTADTDSEIGIRKALWLAVRHSGDSDSTGAMAGNLIGAFCPVDAMPTKWIDHLEIRDVVAGIA